MDSYNYDEIVYLHVPFDKKEYAKTLGAKWCSQVKQWYCTRGHKTLVDEFENPIVKPEKVYLFVPYNLKDDMKKYNGRFDIVKKQWYIYDNNKDKDYLVKLYHQNNFYSNFFGYHFKNDINI
jgi:hypothetical protein